MWSMLMAAEYSASQGLASRAAALSNGFIQLQPEDLEKKETHGVNNSEKWTPANLNSNNARMGM